MQKVCEQIGARPGFGSNTDAAWRKVFWNYPTTGKVNDVTQWISRLVISDSQKVLHTGAAIGLLGELRRNGVLLGPSVHYWLPHPSHPAVEADKPVKLSILLTQFERRMLAREATNVATRGASSLLLSCSPSNSVDDFSDEVLVEILRVALSYKKFHQRGDYSQLSYLSRELEGLKRTDGSILTIFDRSRSLLKSAFQSTAEEDRLKAWGIALTLESGQTAVAAWFKLFTEFDRVYETQQRWRLDRSLQYLMEYITSLPVTPAPKDLRRDLHVDGAEGFLSWCNARIETEATKYWVLRILSNFFNWCKRPGERVGLMVVADLPRASTHNQKTSRNVTPREIVLECRQVVKDLMTAAHEQASALPDQTYVAIDNAVARGSTKPVRYAGHNSSNAVSILPDSILRPKFFERLGLTLQGADGSIWRVLNPTLPTLLYFMLEIPARTIQTRLLDSGEADDMLPTVELTKAETSDGFSRPTVKVTWKPNPGPLRRANRQQGAIKRFNDHSTGLEFAGFRVNTNKGAPAGERKGAERGHDIPWEHPELLYALYRQRLWQAKFNPADRLLARDELNDRTLKPSIAMKGKSPPFVYLFRHARGTDLSERQHPPTGAAVIEFFALLLDEVEARLELAHKKAALEGNGIAGSDPQVLVLSRDAAGEPQRCLYTLHGLRVTGITAFAELGVPLSIIAEFLAGHTDVLMTIYYTKLGPAMMSHILSGARQAYEERRPEHVAAKAATMDPEQLRLLLVSEHDSAFSSLEQMRGFWKPNHDGLCPNGMTRCREGGPFDPTTRKHGPVEGGDHNCPLCQFWLTGPTFMEGQMIYSNATLYKIRGLSLEMQKVWARRRDPANAHRKASIDADEERLEKKVDILLRTLNARSRLIEKSLILAISNYAAEQETDTSLLITRMQLRDAKVHIREASELGMLDHIARVVELIPELDLADSQIARSDAIDRILDRDGFEGMLYRVPREAHVAAANAFIDALLSQTPKGAHPDEVLDAIGSGSKRLFEFDLDKVALEMSKSTKQSFRFTRIQSQDRPSLVSPEEMIPVSNRQEIDTDTNAATEPQPGEPLA